MQVYRERVLHLERTKRFHHQSLHHHVRTLREGCTLVISPEVLSEVNDPRRRLYRLGNWSFRKYAGDVDHICGSRWCLFFDSILSERGIDDRVWNHQFHSNVPRAGDLVRLLLRAHHVPHQKTAYSSSCTRSRRRSLGTCQRCLSEKRNSKPDERHQGYDQSSSARSP